MCEKKVLYNTHVIKGGLQQPPRARASQHYKGRHPTILSNEELDNTRTWHYPHLLTDEPNGTPWLTGRPNKGASNNMYSSRLANTTQNNPDLAGSPHTTTLNYRFSADNQPHWLRWRFYTALWASMSWRGRYLAGSFMVSYPCGDPLSGLFCPVLAS